MMAGVTDETIAYYDANAREYAAAAKKADLSGLIEMFLGYLPGPDRCEEILELGCGSGRDAREMISRGYKVDMTDGSAEMCRIASEYTGHTARQMLFSELEEKGRYDGIWACSSLLHVPKSEIGDILDRCRDALKPGGVMFMCFKLGDFDGERSGRHYSDWGMEEVQSLIFGIDEMEIADIFTTEDSFPGRGSLCWLNVIVRKTTAP